MLWTDNMLIPRNAKHPVDAMTMMDFVYRPDIAAMIADWVWYVCPVPAAERIIARGSTTRRSRSSPLVFPSAESMGPERALQGVPACSRVSRTRPPYWDSIFGSIPFGL